MRNYLLVLNGKGIADYFTKGRAEKAFCKLLQAIDPVTNSIELIELETGNVIRAI